VEIDLGKINVSSKAEEIAGRWRSLPDKKVWVTQFLIEMNEMGFRHNKDFEITSPFGMKIVFEKLNPTELMLDNYRSDHLDFEELDISYKISINFTPLIMHLK
jgi:hypothetical protein